MPVMSSVMSSSLATWTRSREIGKGNRPAAMNPVTGRDVLDELAESMDTTYVDIPDLVPIDDPLESIGAFGVGAEHHASQPQPSQPQQAQQQQAQQQPAAACPAMPPWGTQPAQPPQRQPEQPRYSLRNR